MPPIISRWLPLLCVMAACYMLFSASAIPPNIDQEKSFARLRSPIPPKDYAPMPGERDPFEPYDASPAEKASAVGKVVAKKPSGPRHVQLDGILWDAEHPVAIVNGHIFGKGQKIETLQVLDIFPDGVRMLVDGRVVERHLEKVR